MSNSGVDVPGMQSLATWIFEVCVKLIESEGKLMSEVKKYLVGCKLWNRL